MRDAALGWRLSTCARGQRSRVSKLSDCLRCKGAEGEGIGSFDAARQSGSSRPLTF
jgi:hypothetical protein